MDVKQIPKLISSKTLAVMPVHMFGLPCEVDSINKLASKNDFFVIEDAASSLGSTLNNQQTGTISPFGFHSLNRGKNVSTLAGGIIVWKNNKYSGKLLELCENLIDLTIFPRFIITLKMVGLSLAVRPITYTFLNPILSKFKYTTLHTHFDSFQYTTIQAAMGKQIWKRIDYLTQRRVENGKALMDIFKNKEGFTTPSIPEGSMSAFNQFPVIVSDLNKRDLLQKKLLAQGIETSLMYEKPLHHIFTELNSPGEDPFPNATYLAEHLLLIPPHPQITRTMLNNIENILLNLEKE